MMFERGTRSTIGAGLAIVLLAGGCERPVAARAVVRVAVASNFAATARELAERWAARGGDEVELSVASTGKLYAQIRSGAPFDVLLAADAERPERLERDGLAVAGSRRAYALGRLVLWSPRAERVDGESLRAPGGRVAIANPELAPYGRAAVEVLAAYGRALDERVVRGENVGQAFQFVHGGGAELGLVARSQRPRAGASWEVPASLHAPIEQHAVLLTELPAARRFLEFLDSEEARDVIAAHGYDAP